tara:strand:- start:683 stop:937 length:255 start_codon:yes stop_codon:yes gene_type:complete
MTKLVTLLLKGIGDFFRGLLGDVRKENNLKKQAVEEKNNEELQDALDKVDQVRQTEQEVSNASDDALDDGMRPPSKRGSNRDNR